MVPNTKMGNTITGHYLPESEQLVSRVLQFLHSSDEEMIRLGATIFFSSEFYWSLKYDFFKVNIKRYQDVGYLDSWWSHLMYNNLAGNHLFFRCKQECLFKGWGIWIYSHIDDVPLKIRTIREHVDLNPSK